VTVPKSHPMGRTANSFGMTAYLQDHVCFIGQKEVFEEGSETLSRLLNIDVSNKQIQRVSHYFGAQLEGHIESQIEQPPLSTCSTSENTRCSTTYAMCEGSMVHTKEAGWKEIKLGRVFNSDENIPITEHRNWIGRSTYCAYLGGHEKFLERFELLLNAAADPVFVADGAKWFWDWATACYPQAVQILDYFHAKEYLCEFARLCLKDKATKEKWTATQEDLLFKDGIVRVMGNIRAMTHLSTEAETCRHKIITYYGNNQSRMRYGTYIAKGLSIGSGPIESAHRNVIQKRLKLSGQRWSEQGLQKIANLRVAHKSNNWNQIVQIARTGKIAA